MKWDDTVPHGCISRRKKDNLEHVNYDKSIRLHHSRRDQFRIQRIMKSKYKEIQLLNSLRNHLISIESPLRSLDLEVAQPARVPLKRGKSPQIIPEQAL